MPTRLQCWVDAADDLEQTQLGFDAAAALRKAVHSTLARCGRTYQALIYG